MSAAFRRPSRLLTVMAGVMLAGVLAGAAQAETVTVSVDEARIMKLPDNVATIVIGNPLIADATLQGGGVLVLTGKGFGSTNMLALNRSGKIVLDTTVQVTGPGSADLVVVYKGVERESYSCAPECEKRLTLGDSATYFGNILGQSGARIGGGGGGGGAAPSAR
ncbi:pilus assembly protein CpaC [Pseudolabrys sp. Root1462]|jgi:Pilus formation protein N terminal region|uniref:pilus assembly protein N-terminal domain-containing protein n=1 Tax=Pseudolabrys sp. Root1462 TaxID=1736466 RepID=UPI0007024454|nr:pilus assembly protein N-terminal domain-containing protein [Pseudolabrys sp. Root1462]KQY97228.1 pilus assembly protein CpaC [Pseudolabrys sp. Root1462]